MTGNPPSLLRAPWVLDLPFFALLASLCGLVVAIGPLATSDGPVHVAFAHQLAVLGTPEYPLQSAIYERQLHPAPNVAVYAAMWALQRIVSIPASELVVQLVGIVGLAFGARHALGAVAPANRWLAVFVLPFVLSQSLFWGLYNFVWSAAAFFFVAGTCLRYVRDPAPRRVLLVAAGVLVAYFAHGAGFLMSLLFVGGSATWPVLAARVVHGRWDPALLRRAAALLAALLPALALFANFVLRSAGAPTEYSTPLSMRLWDFATLRNLSMHGYGSRVLLVLVFQPAIVLAVALAAVQLWRRARDGEGAHVASSAAAMLAVLAAGYVVTALVFPDTAGGGWTHFQRVLLFPFFVAVLFAATARFPPRLAAALAVGVGAVGLHLVATAAVVQVRTLEQRRAVLAFDAAIGRHCTILPLVLEAKTLDGDTPVSMSYNPLFHSGTLFEYSKDRVALFSHLARLHNYPIRYRDGRNVQNLIYGWTAETQDTELYRVDVPAFERATGIPVDYVLVVGEEATSDRKRRLRESVTALGFTRLTPAGPGPQLWRRDGPAGASRCTSRARPAPDGPATIAPPASGR